MTSSQKLSALETANQTRSAGSIFRRELRAMARPEAAALAARVIRDGANGALSSQYVDQLLIAVPSFGPKRVRALLDEADIRSRLRVRDLSETQREALAKAMLTTIPRENPPTPKPGRPAPKRLPSAPFSDWIERRYGSLELAARALSVPGGRPVAGIERTLRRIRENRTASTATIEDLLTHAPISMHDLYSPRKYPGLYR